MRNTVRLIIALSIVTIVGTCLSIRFRRASTETFAQESKLVVHEWGTFTSIAGKNGFALDWRPLNGSSDLPKFVHSNQNGGGFRHRPSKGSITDQIRMETPVIYFYANQEMNIQASVDFPKGTITEWYPQARDVARGINWGSLKIASGTAMNLPADYSENHYYAARKTDAAMVQVCGTGGQPIEQEKFLFYRGVGSFDLPLTAQLENNRIKLGNRGNEAIKGLVVFENRSGKLGYRFVDRLAGQMVLDRPTLDGNADAVIQNLRQTLVSSGLYQKEADAMIETWRKSWLGDEGMRVFYVLPRSITDTVLPLKIDPQPSELVRVLIGRTEVITPELENKVKEQVQLLNDKSPQVRSEAQREIKTFGRFYEPILRSILVDETDGAVRARIQQALASSLAEAR